MVRFIIALLVSLIAHTAYAGDSITFERSHLGNSGPRDWLEGSKSLGGVFAWGGGYHDQYYQAASLGLGGEWGDLSAALFLGRAKDGGGLSQNYSGFWVYNSKGRHEEYLYAEKARDGSSFHRAYARYYPTRNFFIGVAKESHLSYGPTIGVKLDNLKLWIYAPTKATDGDRKVVLGATIEF